jgi:O-antigen biosynthesis protein
VPTVSVFTPSHKPQYLDECLRSLLDQTFDDWEWIVLLNGKARWSPPTSDHRVRVLEAQSSLRGVGALKAMACSYAQGRVLLELDHDDLLAPDALAHVVDAFDVNPDASLVYSGWAEIDEGGAPRTARFNEAMGWTYEEEEVLGQTVLRCDPFFAYPSEIGYIWFAPNHLRAFRRSAYESAGGYDPSLDILDDQELMCRLYLEGGFVRLPSCLYLQRIHRSNTQADPRLNARIQTETIGLYDRFIARLSSAWAQRSGLSIVELGMGPDSFGDRPEDQSGEVVRLDLSQGDLPLRALAEDSVGVVHAIDCLQFVHDQVGLFNELYRLLAHGGMVLSSTPSTDGRGAFQDPRSTAYYNENSFWYLTNAEYARRVPGLGCRFQLARMFTHYPDEFCAQHQMAYVTAHLVALKDGPRLAGEILI